MIERHLTDQITMLLEHYPAVAILGARQVGKTTLAKQLLKGIPMLYLDLERPSDIALLEDAEAFFRIHNGKLICLDEIQLRPDLFNVLRSIIDDESFQIKFLLTGSASPELLKQSSQSLAGRIIYKELPPLTINELNEHVVLADYLNRGGFPLSILAMSDELSFIWRENFILTFLQRDLQQLGYSFPTATLNRLWKMIAFMHGQVINYSQLSSSMGYSDTTIKKYVDILSATFMLRILMPYHANVKKRLIKSPKVYIRDVGILNALLNITNYETLYGHPVYGSAWEGMCIEQIVMTFTDWEPYFYRTSNGTEIDLILVKGNDKIAVEFKTSTAPKVTAGFWNALEDINPDKAYIIAPVAMSYPYKNDTWVYTLSDFLKLKYMS